MRRCLWNFKTSLMGTFSKNKQRKVGECIIAVLSYLPFPLSSSAHAWLCYVWRVLAHGITVLWSWLRVDSCYQNIPQFLQKSSASIAMLMLILLGNVLMLSEGLPGVNNVFSLRNGMKLSRIPSDFLASRLAIDIDWCSFLSPFVDHYDIRRRYSKTRHW